MKTLKFVSAVFLAILLAAPALVHAQDFRAPSGGSRATDTPPRTFLGLPIPQQWSGSRRAATNQYSGNLSDGQCTTGNCQNRGNATGNCTTGTCRNCNCPNGACANGLCASGQCPTCANGQCVGCANGECGRGQSAGRNCVNGQCRVNQNPNARDNSGAQGDWSPRTTRSNYADPFRGGDSQPENDKWTQRPALRNPVKALYPSSYSQSDLDLRRPYFNNQSGDLNKTQAGDRASAARDTHAPRPSDRSMFSAPADRVNGLAQI